MPLRPCLEPGCRELVQRGRCAAHQSRADASYAERQRENRARIADRRALYSTPEWRRLRAQALAVHPVCQSCGRERATDVDHVVPHCGDVVLFLDPANLQTLCHPCHARKTSREDGGFGNRRQSR